MNSEGLSILLACPRCNGSIPVKIGEGLVVCPYCELSCAVSGVSGIPAIRSRLQIDYEGALSNWRAFLGSSIAIEPKLRYHARLSEIFLAYLPFWQVTGDLVEIQLGKIIAQEPLTETTGKRVQWHGPAMDLSEFGLHYLSVDSGNLELFEMGDIRREGMLFMPQGSVDELLPIVEAALTASSSKQTYQRVVNMQVCLLYYPVWVIRYLVFGKAYQVVIAGSDGTVLYGMAPGSAIYRASALILGMGLGSILTVALPALLYRFVTHVSLLLLLLLLLLGIGLMLLGAYIFQEGTEYEVRKQHPRAAWPAVLETGLPPEAREFLERFASIRGQQR